MNNAGCYSFGPLTNNGGGKVELGAVQASGKLLATIRSEIVKQGMQEHEIVTCGK